MIFNGSDREGPSILGHVFIFCGSRASLVALMIKNLPSIWETWIWSLGQKDPLEKGMATYSSILSWRIPWTEEPGRLQSRGSQRIRHDWATNAFTVYTSHSRPYFPGCVLSGLRLGGSMLAVPAQAWQSDKLGSDPASVTAWLHDPRQATYSPPISVPSSVKWVLVCTFCDRREGKWGV